MGQAAGPQPAGRGAQRLPTGHAGRKRDPAGGPLGLGRAGARGIPGPARRRRRLAALQRRPGAVLRGLPAAAGPRPLRTAEQGRGLGLACVAAARPGRPGGLAAGPLRPRLRPPRGRCPRRTVGRGHCALLGRRLPQPAPERLRAAAAAAVRARRPAGPADGLGLPLRARGAGTPADRRLRPGQRRGRPARRGGGGRAGDAGTGHAGRAARPAAPR